MRLASILVALAVLSSGCAPSVDLRILAPSEPLAVGRRVIVPVGPDEAHQADLHLISLDAPLTGDQEARRRLSRWLAANPGKEVWILHRYDDDRLEGPYRHS